jgi:hypothetical protein
MGHADAARQIREITEHIAELLATLERLVPPAPESGG